MFLHLLELSDDVHTCQNMSQSRTQKQFKVDFPPYYHTVLHGHVMFRGVCFWCLLEIIHNTAASSQPIVMSQGQT